jgi:hypothetical protein
MDGREKPMLQSDFIELGSKGPAQVSFLKALKVVLNGPSPDVEASSNLTG